IRFQETDKRRVSDLQGSHLNSLNAVPSQVTLQLQPSQPNLYDAAGVEFFNFFPMIE
ncbi:hypothetical protein MKW92_027715, partial [Papaver armeniacum]